jgi:integrase
VGFGDPLLPFACLKLADGAPQRICPAASSSATTAVADQMIRRNPCTIKGASTVHTPERPTATVQEVYDLADAMQPRYRALVLMAGFLGLRWGELIGLHRRDIDLDRGAVRVRRAVAELRACTSTIFGTRATPWQPPRGRARVS